MSGRALVLHGVDFSTNKLGTVTWIGGGENPCMALVLNKNTASMSKPYSTETLIASPTPSNTTDSITWESSDETVATVNASGVVTQIGVGTCTITAECGGFSASCTITATATYIADVDFTVIHGNGIQLASDSGADYIEPYTSEKQRSYLMSENIMGGYKAVSRSETYANYYPIPLPKNATSMTISVSGETKVFQAAFAYFLDAFNPAEHQDLAPSQKGAKYYATGGGTFGTDAKTKTISLTSLSSNVNAFTIRMTAVDSSELPLTNTITITFE